MPGQAGTLESIAQQVAQALQPLESQLTAHNIIPFLAELGLQFPPQLLTPSFQAAMNAGSSAAGALPAMLTQLATDITNENLAGILADGEKLIQQIAAVISALEDLGTELGSLAGSLPGMNPGEVTAFATSLAENLLGYLLIAYVENIEPGVVGVANLLGVIDYIINPGVTGDPTHPAYITRRLELDNLGQLFSSPLAMLQTLYQWGSPSFDGTQMIPRLAASLDLLGFPAIVVPSGPPNSLTVSFFTLQSNPATNPPGLLGTITEALQSGINETLPISSAWSVQVQAQGTFAASLQAIVTPPVGVALKPPSGTLTGLLQMQLAAQAPSASQPLIVVGETGSSYVGANSLTFGAGVTVTWDSTSNTASTVPLVQFGVTQGTVFLDMSEADGFLTDILGNTPVQATFNLAGTWQPDTGLHLQDRSATPDQSAITPGSRARHRADALSHRRCNERRHSARSLRCSRRDSGSDSGIRRSHRHHRKSLVSKQGRQSRTRRLADQVQAAEWTRNRSRHGARRGRRIPFVFTGPVRGSAAGIACRRRPGCRDRRARHDHAGRFKGLLVPANHYFRLPADPVGFRFHAQQRRRPRRHQPHDVDGCAAGRFSSPHARHDPVAARPDRQCTRDHQ